MKRLAKFLGLSHADRLLLVEAVLLLAVARAAVLAGRVDWVIRSGKVDGCEAAAPPDGLPARVRWAVAAAAGRVPWNAVCLPQALAAKMMLRRRGVAGTLYIGVRPGATLEAHAWLQSGNVIVTGNRHLESFQAVYQHSEAVFS